LEGVTAWLAANNKKGFLGEFAGANNATCRQAIESALQHIENNKNYWIGWTWWAAGPWWGPYMYSIEPTNGADAAQMSWLAPFLQ
jgi:endoglucanase